MVHITARLAAQYVGDKGIENVLPDKCYPVIGYRVEKRKTNDGGREFDSIDWLCLNEVNRPIWLYASNCKTFTVGA
jgi:hypothetical protein